MAKKLLIVESPAKAKTIEKILGKDYLVKSSYGHVRDLSKKQDAVNVDNDFEPQYEITSDKQQVVKELRSLSKKMEEVILATDEDREGEAISWHLCEVLNLDPEHTKRIVFREITKPAIQKAVTVPRKVDINLVNAQQARRILDRLVGYELSETLWKKVKGKLSAGRVQSVAVKLLVDREREIASFESKFSFKISADFEVVENGGSTKILSAEAKKKIYEEQEAMAYLQVLKDTKSFVISNVEIKPAKKRPSPPFTTSTLQQEASRKFGFTVKRTMSVAQKLYEQGHITYMRTDSTSLSAVAISAMAEVVEHRYGSEYVHTRQFTTKKSNAQEAHEAIRPTYAQNTSISGDRDMQRLYELIWKRAVASQMADAQLEKTIVTIVPDGSAEHSLEAQGEVLIFDGFLKLYIASADDDEEEEAKGLLPPVNKGQSLPLLQSIAKQKFSKPPPRYTEAGLVKKLEELGIGRPSTYAPTISRIMEETRGYVIKDSREGREQEIIQLALKKNHITRTTLTENTGAVTNRLFPTDIGIVVSDFLAEHFTEIMNYQFTAECEAKFDNIAEGKIEWKEMLRNFYVPFHEEVKKTIDQAERVKGERVLGKDPKTGLSVLTRISRFGRPIAQIGHMDELTEDQKPQFANLKIGQSIETLNLEEALELFKLPVTLGEYENLPVLVNDGRYGPYVKWGETFINIGRKVDPLTVDYDKAVEYIQAKKEADKPVTTYKGQEVTKGAGRFGPFLKVGNTYVNIPKKYDPENLSQEEMHTLIEAKMEKEANRYIQQWPDDKISIENGRWGPFIRVAKKNYKLPKGSDGNKMTAEEAKKLSLEEVKKIVEEQAK